jgi:CRISPR-associated protein Cas5h
MEHLQSEVEAYEGLAFDISSDYANFRQPYSTTSSWTNAILPETAALGIVGEFRYDSGGFGQSKHIAELKS